MLYSKKIMHFIFMVIVTFLWWNCLSAPDTNESFVPTAKFIIPSGLAPSGHSNTESGQFLRERYFSATEFLYFAATKFNADSFVVNDLMILHNAGVTLKMVGDKSYSSLGGFSQVCSQIGGCLTKTNSLCWHQTSTSASTVACSSLVPNSSDNPSLDYNFREQDDTLGFDATYSIGWTPPTGMPWNGWDMGETYFTYDHEHTVLFSGNVSNAGFGNGGTPDYNYILHLPNRLLAETFESDFQTMLYPAPFGNFAYQVLDRFGSKAKNVPNSFINYQIGDYRIDFYLAPYQAIMTEYDARISSAAKSIDIASYYILMDSTASGGTSSLRDTLVAKNTNKVPIRMIVDDIGSTHAQSITGSLMGLFPPDATSGIKRDNQPGQMTANFALVDWDSPNRKLIIASHGYTRSRCDRHRCNATKTGWTYHPTSCNIGDISLTNPDVFNNMDGFVIVISDMVPGLNNRNRLYQQFHDFFEIIWNNGSNL